MKRINQIFAWLFYTMIIIRPSLDLFTDNGFGIGLIHFNPAVFLSMAMIGLAGFYLIQLNSQTRIAIFNSYFTWIFTGWVFLLFFWALAPMNKIYINGENSLIGLREWVRLLSLLSVYFIAFILAQKGDGRKVITAVLLSFIFPAAMGIYQIVFHQGLLVRGVHRINSTFVHPNPFSFYLVLIIGITFWHWRWIGKKIYFSFLLLAEFGLLLATYSFTGMAMLAGLAGTLALGGNRKIRQAAIAMLLIFVVVFIVTPSGRQRIRMELKMDHLDEIERTGKETSSFTWRLLNWRFLYREWEKSPMFGYGLNTSKLVNPMIKKEDQTGFDPHNDYVRYLTETGLTGFLLFLFFLFSAGYSLWKAYRRCSIPPDRHYILVAMAVYVSWLVGSMNDNLISATGYQYVLWPVFAVALAGKEFFQEKSSVS